jgi:hypothetical protein
MASPTPVVEPGVNPVVMDAIAAMPELPVVRAASLYSVEWHLDALANSAETVPEELEEEYGQELCATLLAAVATRDRVAHFMAHLENQVAFAKAEIARLKEREAFFTKVYDRMEMYVMRVLEGLGLDDRGKRRKLEGTVCTFALNGCDKRAEISDEEAVPAKYKRVVVSLPLETWELLCDSLDLDLRETVLAEVKSAKIEVSKTAVKNDLKANVEVPGAKLAGGVRLVRT